MGATVVSGVDATPIFEAPEHVFDLVALLIEEGVIGDGDLPIGFRGDAGGDAALCQGGAEPIGVVALVGKKLLALGMAGNISAAPW
jgi:hypothetical protein